MDDVVKIGKRLQALRVEAGMNQHQLAHVSGVSQRALQDLERGVSNPTVGTILSISKALNKNLIITDTDQYVAKSHFDSEVGELSKSYSKLCSEVESITNKNFKLQDKYIRALEDLGAYRKIPQDILMALKSANSQKIKQIRAILGLHDQRALGQDKDEVG